MIETTRQSWLADWLCSRIGLVATQHLRCIGNVIDGKLVGVVGYDQFNGASIMMHAAGEPHWLTKDMLWAVFDYPFNVCGVNMIIGMVPSGNRQAIRFNNHIGFKTKLRLYGAHPDGELILMTMHRDECRYLERKHHGQEVEAACST